MWLLSSNLTSNQENYSPWLWSSIGKGAYPNSNWGNSTDYKLGNSRRNNIAISSQSKQAYVKYPVIW